MIAAISVWWAVGIGVFDFVALAFFVTVMIVAAKKIKEQVAPYLTMLFPPKP